MEQPSDAVAGFDYQRVFRQIQCTASTERVINWPLFPRFAETRGNSKFLRRKGNGAIGWGERIRTSDWLIQNHSFLSMPSVGADPEFTSTG